MEGNRKKKGRASSKILRIQYVIIINVHVRIPSSPVLVHVCEWNIIVLEEIKYFCSFECNRFLHTFLGKIGWSSTSDRNFMSFREWSAAKWSKRNKNFYHEWKITRAFPKTHVSTYFFRKPTTFTIANS